MNYSIFIDDEFVQGIYSGMFITKDSVGNVRDSIPFQYEVGDLTLTSEGYKKLINLKQGLKVDFKFKYKQSLIYSKEIAQSWLIQRYEVFKIYNFSNKRNYKYFKERKGYGVEVYIPSYGLSLLRKFNNFSSK